MLGDKPEGGGGSHLRTVRGTSAYKNYEISCHKNLLGDGRFLLAVSIFHQCFMYITVLRQTLCDALNLPGLYKTVPW